MRHVVIEPNGCDALSNPLPVRPKWYFIACWRKVYDGPMPAPVGASGKGEGDGKTVAKKATPSEKTPCACVCVTDRASERTQALN